MQIRPRAATPSSPFGAALIGEKNPQRDGDDRATRGTRPHVGGALSHLLSAISMNEIIAPIPDATKQAQERGEKKCFLRAARLADQILGSLPACGATGHVSPAGRASRPAGLFGGQPGVSRAPF